MDSNTKAFRACLRAILVKLTAEVTKCPKAAIETCIKGIDNFLRANGKVKVAMMLSDNPITNNVELMMNDDMKSGLYVEISIFDRDNKSMVVCRYGLPSSTDDQEDRLKSMFQAMAQVTYELHMCLRLHERLLLS